ncbi:DUF2975 domain-containing protein [Nitrospirillum iridis]|uniref:DUF2975 domain-containing protein n=1 Tax=Nitrospirillum iridis TaxID=765888 RepID=A0A7X0B4M5_9PROT|nr:DUF2975 domain-containing protein [Nitrospirillum iridis]MBB6254124.1 hypothetical protein [Nitrospirillum iridis]
MINRDNLVRSSALAVRVAAIANGAFVCALLLGLAASWLMADRLAALLPGDDLAEKVAGLRWMMALGLAMAGGAFVVLRALGGMVATVAAGDPFIAANTDRLHRIGWALLFLQLLDIPGYAIRWSFPALGSAGPDAGLSPGGWIAVLMVFVLARIFAAGTAMRDDLEGVV